MRKHLIAFALAAGLLLAASPGRADVYAGPQDFTAPGTLVLGVTNGGTVVVTAAGSPTTPVFTIQGSSDPATVAVGSATWTTLPAYPVAGGSSATSLTSTGKWAVNTSGMTRVRVNLTALAGGDLLITMDGGPSVSIVNGVVTLGAGGTVSPVAGTTGGATPYHLAGGTAASTNSTSIKGSAGTLYSLTAINTTATVYYLRVYDSATAPTCSSATGAAHSYPIPAATTGAGLTIPLGAVGEAYANGIGYCVTGGGGDTDNTNAATGIFINASYK